MHPFRDFQPLRPMWPGALNFGMSVLALHAYFYQMSDTVSAITFLLPEGIRLPPVGNLVIWNVDVVDFCSSQRSLDNTGLTNLEDFTSKNCGFVVQDMLLETSLDLKFRSMLLTSHSYLVILSLWQLRLPYLPGWTPVSLGFGQRHDPQASPCQLPREESTTLWANLLLGPE